MYPTELPPCPADDARLSREVWRSRAALARHAATELREQVRVSVWMARRQLSYRRWLVDEARQHVGAAAPPARSLHPPRSSRSRAA